MGFSVEVGIPAITVFIQGLLSFFSPCVLPLVPLYIGYLAGGTRTVDEEGRVRYSRKKVMINTLFFVIWVISPPAQAPNPAAAGGSSSTPFSLWWASALHFSCWALDLRQRAGSLAATEPCSHGSAALSSSCSDYSSWVCSEAPCWGRNTGFLSG